MIEIAGGLAPINPRRQPKKINGPTPMLRSPNHGALLSRLRGAAVALETTVTALLVVAALRELYRLEALHNGGEPFAPVGAIKRGKRRAVVCRGSVGA